MNTAAKWSWALTFVTPGLWLLATVIGAAAESVDRTPGSDASVMAGAGGLMFVLSVLSSVAYMLPALIAGHRWHASRNAILVLTFFGGWTVVGWIAAIVWAATDNVEQPAEATA